MCGFASPYYRFSYPHAKTRVHVHSRYNTTGTPCRHASLPRAGLEETGTPTGKPLVANTTGPTMNKPSLNTLLQNFESEQVQRELPVFGTGDTVIVNVKVKEGARERLQAYEGVVIARKNAGLNSAFTVRKISHGFGVERVFQNHSAIIDSVTVKRRGAVRAGKLYYLRGLEGRKARIKEDLAGNAKAKALAAAEAKTAGKSDTGTDA